jgi:hypothetical protein
MPRSKPFAEFRDTPLWHTIAEAVAELETTREIAVATAPEYVIGFLCQQLVTRQVVVPDALRDAP